MLAILGAFLAAGVVGAAMASKLGLWETPIAGSCAAFAVVVVASIAAPHHRFVSSMCAFVMGALVAWKFLEPSFYPDSYGERVYQSTHLPLVATYMGGLLGLAVAWILTRKSMQKA